VTELVKWWQFGAYRVVYQTSHVVSRQLWHMAPRWHYAEQMAWHVGCTPMTLFTRCTMTMAAAAVTSN